MIRKLSGIRNIKDIRLFLITMYVIFRSRVSALSNSSSLHKFSLILCSVQINLIIQTRAKKSSVLPFLNVLPFKVVTKSAVHQ